MIENLTKIILKALHKTPQIPWDFIRLIQVAHPGIPDRVISDEIWGLISAGKARLDEHYRIVKV